MPIAIAEFQFYLPFALPRESDWAGQRVEFKFVAEDAVARVNALERGEPLFIDKAGETLSAQFVDRALSPPSPPLRVAVRDFTVDRLRVEVRGTVSAAGDVQRGDVRNAFYVLAIRAANAFLSHARVAAASPDRMEIDVNFDPSSSNTVVLTPMTVIWTAEDGASLPVYGSVAGGPLNVTGSVWARRLSRGTASFAAIGNAVRRLGEFPDIVRTLLLDAEAYVIAFHVSEALLVLGAACEIASDRYIDGSGRARDHAVKAALGRTNITFAERHFNAVPSLIHGRSLGQDDARNFALIERMYRARNNVAHEGYPYEDTSGGKVAVTPRVATEFIEACRDAIAWLDELSPR